jgi:RNA polymerase sigma factor (sigma-70 family)
MTLHPSFHSELTRHHELELRRRVSRQSVRPRAVAERDVRAEELIDIVRAAQAGDREAWEPLVTEFTPLLRSIARQYRLASAAAEDVVQATWTAAFCHIGQLREPEAFPGWLCVTARRQALRTIESRQREVPVEEPRSPEESDDASFETALLREEARAAVRAAVERLPERQRSLMNALLNGSASSYAVLSSKLMMPLGSIGPTRERALARLRRDRGLRAALLLPRDAGR